MKKGNSKRNSRLVMLESALTAAILSIPIMTPFYNSIGLNQAEIALSQIAFTIVVMLLNIPLGFVADRFSRKWANVIGDFLVGTALLLYSNSHSFWFVVVCESICGVGCALSQGVDSTLLKHFTGKTDKSGKLFKNKFARMNSYNYLVSLLVTLLGGPIGAISFRLAIAVSSIPFYIGSIVSIFIEDDSEKLEANEAPVKDIVKLVKRNLKNSKLRLRIAAYAVSSEVTHGIIWVFTPLMLSVGVPLSVVSIGWVINSLASFVGSRAAERYAKRFKEWQIFTIPVALVVFASSVMLINLNAFTVFFYALFGLALGWRSATMMPFVKEHIKDSEQSSVESLTRVVSQLLYICVVWIINRAADIELSYALVATIVIFVPLAIPIALKLRKE